MSKHVQAEQGAVVNPPPTNDKNQLNADVTWQELQGIADRVRVLKLYATRLSDSVRELQTKARCFRQRNAL